MLKPMWLCQSCTTLQARPVQMNPDCFIARHSAIRQEDWEERFGEGLNYTTYELPDRLRSTSGPNLSKRKPHAVNVKLYFSPIRGWAGAPQEMEFEADYHTWKRNSKTPTQATVDGVRIVGELTDEMIKVLTMGFFRDTLSKELREAVQSAIEIPVVPIKWDNVDLT